MNPFSIIVDSLLKVVNSKFAQHILNQIAKIKKTDEKSKEISSVFAIIENVQVLSLDKARMTSFELYSY